MILRVHPQAHFLNFPLSDEEEGNGVKEKGKDGEIIDKEAIKALIV